MARQIPLTPHMTPAPCDAAIGETWIGQAHIAGTGPAGRTCRECRFWYGWKTEIDHVNGGTREVPSPPRYWSSKRAETPGELKPALCNRAILNKSRMNIPHHARACRLFEPADNPPAAKREG